MNKYNEDVKRKKDSFSNKNKSSFFSLKKLKSLFQYENPADAIITDESDLKVRIERAANIIVDALYQWQLLLAGFDARLKFVLQPLAYWTRNYLTPEEEAVFFAIDHCPNNFYRLFSGILGESVHPIFFNAIQENAEKYKISTYDMNVMLSASERIAETLFVDRVHFTDIGNEVLANIIKNYLLDHNVGAGERAW